MYKIEDKAECVKALNEKLKDMPVDALMFISGAVELAGMLEAKAETDKEAS